MGLILVICYITAIVTIFYFLEELQEDHSTDEKDVENDDDDDDAPILERDTLLSSPSKKDDILVRMLSTFAFKANFQLIETGFAPAAYDALGWGPVESSVAFGSISFIIAADMFVVIQLSKRGVSDSNVLCGGLVMSTVAYTLLYFIWTKDTMILKFYLPIFIASSAFPFLSPTTRSVFTMAVNNKPCAPKVPRIDAGLIGHGRICEASRCGCLLFAAPGRYRYIHRPTGT